MQPTNIRRSAAILAGAVAIQALVLTPPVNDGGVLYPIIVLLGPIASGAIAQLLGRGWRPLAATWALAGAVMAIDDWLLAGAFQVDASNQAFHAVLAVLMAALAAVGAAIARLRYRDQKPVPAARER